MKEDKQTYPLSLKTFKDIKNLEQTIL